MVNFGPRESVPEKFSKRNLYVHNASVTLMRTTPQECTEIGELVARKLNQATGATELFIPLKGVSAIAVEGQVFWDPAADAALIEALKANLDPSKVTVHELDTDINN